MHPFKSDDEYREWLERNTMIGASARLSRAGRMFLDELAKALRLYVVLDGITWLLNRVTTRRGK